MKKAIVKNSIIMFLLLGVAACSSEDEESQAIIFAGSWSGTFTGGDSGTWEITVSNTGSVDGEVFSNNFQGFLDVNGSVDTSGDFRATAGSAENGATFTGNFAENSSSGTWENVADDITGTWQGSRN